MSEPNHEAVIMGMPGANGTLLRLAHYWPAHNLGVWMVGEVNRKTPMPQTAEALANYISAVIDAFACQTSDRKAAIFGHGTGVLTMVEASLKARIAKEQQAKSGLILPGLGG